MGNRLQAVALRVPDKGIGAVQRDGRGRLGGESLQSCGDALENRQEAFAIGTTHLCSKGRVATDGNWPRNLLRHGLRVKRSGGLGRPRRGSLTCAYGP